jgi:hypothetical protein
MGEKLVIGPFNRGLRNDREPFVIDNDSFPLLINAYQWRGRIKRKRGTSLLGRLTRFFNSNIASYGSIASFNLVGGAGNLITGFGLQTNASIVPGSVSIVVGANTYTDPGLAGILVGTPGLGASGTINYATGAITIAGGAGSAVTGLFLYYPDLPVMGLEDLANDTSQFPGTLGFDTRYSYNISPNYPYPIWDVSFYKNPPTDSVNLPGYIQKTGANPVTPTSWNGQDYQQFWTVNYEGALWATNGITVPFDRTNVGMQYKFITGMSIAATPPNGPSVVNLTIVGHGLSVGDFVFINEVQYTAPNLANSINFQTGYVIAVLGVDNVSVEFPFAYLTGTYSTGGIAQYLTNRSDITRDGIRWYDGDPTNSNATNPPLLTGNRGWVNFSPPLSEFIYSISDLPAAQYYLVTARMIVPFKDRLLFIGPVIQSSTPDSQIYLQDTIIWSQNGTPYYTSSFTGDPSLSTTVFFPVLTPQAGGISPKINYTATASAYWEDQTGFGGFLKAGLDESINSEANNEDVLIIGFTTNQTRLVYSGNDLEPFYFYLINSELGSGSVFSAINMDKGVLTVGTRGFVITSQVEAVRFDLEIPDQVFQIRRLDNGSERVCSNRDFINEWVYFTYPQASDNYVGDDHSSKFPNQTVQYNYRDQSWAIFNETYTTYGQFREKTGFTWSTVGQTFPTWNQWDEAWNAGSSAILQPKVIAGNQQGFIVFRDDGTAESNSLYIQGFSSSIVTSPNHTLNNGDFITISGVLGTIGSQVNGRTFSISMPTINTFKLNPSISSGTYLGGGVIKRMYIPQIQTKQFPSGWGLAKKTRIGVQRYLLTKTDRSQIQLLIYLSQDDANPYNDGPILPLPNSQNDGLIFSTVLYTCPESTNLGLTPANTNLQQLTLVSPSNSESANNQEQIWHRVNTSLIGDTVQLGFTISDAQMRELLDSGESFTISGITLANPAVLTITNAFSAPFSSGQLVKINGVQGMTQINYNTNGNIVYNIISSTQTTVTIEVDSTGFTPYMSDGTVNQVYNFNQFAEIELHGIIIETSASMELT